MLNLISLLNVNNLKTIGIVLGAAAIGYLYLSNKHFREVSKIETENTRQNILKDSTRYAEQTYTKDQLDLYLDNNRKDLQEFLQENKIKTNRLERIITQKLRYSDTQTRKIDLKPVLEAIKGGNNIKIPVIDSTRCMIIKGYVILQGDTLSLDITDRQFKNKSDVITYWKRKPWKFLGLDITLFGKKQAIVLIKDDCGRSETFVINKN